MVGDPLQMRELLVFDVEGRNPLPDDERKEDDERQNLPAVSIDQRGHADLGGPRVRVAGNEFSRHDDLAGQVLRDARGRQRVVGPAAGHNQLPGHLAAHAEILGETDVDGAGVPILVVIGLGVVVARLVEAQGDIRAEVFQAGKPDAQAFLDYVVDEDAPLVGEEEAKVNGGGRTSLASKTNSTFLTPICPHCRNSYCRAAVRLRQHVTSPGPSCAGLSALRRLLPIRTMFVPRLCATSTGCHNLNQLLPHSHIYQQNPQLPSKRHQTRKEHAYHAIFYKTYAYYHPIANDAHDPHLSHAP